MAIDIRRVVTRHNENGRAVCVSDETATNLLQRPSRPGVTLTNHAWSDRGKETCRIAFVLVDAVATTNGNET